MRSNRETALLLYVVESEEQRAKALEDARKSVQSMVDFMQECGFDVHITHEPLQPLAMGNHRARVELSFIREFYSSVPVKT